MLGATPFFITLFLVFFMLSSYNDALWIRICALICALCGLGAAIFRSLRVNRRRRQRRAEMEALIRQAQKDKKKASSAKKAAALSAQEKK